MTRSRWLGFGPCVGLLLAPGPAWACTLCRSATGERVRAGVFGPDFGWNVAATLLPFAVFLAVVALIHGGPPGGGRGPRP